MEQDMSDDVFYDSLAEVMDLPPQDLYAQLAEEGAELTQASLNQEVYARVIQRGIEKRRTDGYEK